MPQADIAGLKHRCTQGALPGGPLSTPAQHRRKYWSLRCAVEEVQVAVRYSDTSFVGIRPETGENSSRHRCIEPAVKRRRVSSAEISSWLPSL
jgi:hypothetical protein